MKTKGFSILKELKSGWYYPYRSKKAHLCVTDKTVCGKYKTSKLDKQGILPISAFYERELCAKCLKKYKKGELK